MKVTVRIGYWRLGFPGLLAIVFITLRLLGKVDWSWWWVLSPLWITGVISLVLFGVLVLIWTLGRR